MIFQPTVNPNGPSIDTDSPEFRARAQWTADKLHCPYPELETYMDATPAAHNQDYPDVEASMHEYANLVFSLPDQAPIRVDAEAVWRYPKAVVNYIAAKTGRADLQWWGPDYAPPGAPPADWQIPGSHIGPPLPYPPGHFQFKWTGEAEGATISGASGRTYTLVRIGIGMFSSLEWRGN